LSWLLHWAPEIIYIMLVIKNVFFVFNPNSDVLECDSCCRL
jgi:hypothetical protein